MKRGGPIPIRFPSVDEKRIRVYAIEKGVTLSAAIRALVKAGLGALEPKPSQEPAPPPRRRVLSRGVG